MRRLWLWWLARCQREQDTRPLALTRIAIALVVVVDLLLAGGLIWLRGRKRFVGQVFLTYFTIYPILRSLNELVRQDEQRGYFMEQLLGENLTNAQGISLAMFSAALLGWIVLSRRKAVAEE